MFSENESLTCGSVGDLSKVARVVCDYIAMTLIGNENKWNVRKIQYTEGIKKR